MGSPQAVSARSVQSLCNTSTGLSMVAERIRPLLRDTVMSASNVSLPTSAAYLSPGLLPEESEDFSTSIQLLAVSETGARIHSVGHWIVDSSGGTWRTTSTAVPEVLSTDFNVISKSSASCPMTTYVP